LRGLDLRGILGLVFLGELKLVSWKGVKTHFLEFSLTRTSLNTLDSIMQMKLDGSNSNYLTRLVITKEN